MSITIDPKVFCSTCGTAAAGTAASAATDSGRLRTSLITIIVLILIVYLCGGRVFGGYGNYPGYGGFSVYGYTPKPKMYRYWDDYIMNYEPDF